MIRMIAPRLIDPRAKSEYFIGLFRFSEQKDIVKAALKSRMHTLNSAMFSRTEHTLLSPQLEDSSGLLSQSRIRSRRRSRVSLHASMNRSDGKLLSKIHENSKSDDGNDDTTLPTTSRESSQNDVGSATSTPIKVTNISRISSDRYHPRDLLSNGNDEYPYSQVASPMSVETICSDRSEVDDSERSLNHNIKPFSPSKYSHLVNDNNRSHLLEDETSVFLDYGSPSRSFDNEDKNISPVSTSIQTFHNSQHSINNLLSASSQTEYANNNFSSHTAKAQLSEKAAHRNTLNTLTSNTSSLLRRSYSVEDVLISTRHSDTELFDSSTAFMTSPTHPSKNADDLSNSSPIASNRESLVDEPEPIEGWLNKYSRRGLFKNWRLRYFTLRAGKLRYYSEKRSQFEGSNLKVTYLTVQFTLTMH